MQKKACVKLTVVFWAASVLLTACGRKTEQQVLERKPVSSMSAGSVSAEHQTEEQYRAAIALLGDSEEDLKQAAEDYEELLARDLFQEEDYIALAGVYEKLGDVQKQYGMLSKLQRLFPSEEYIEMLNAITWEADDSNVRIKGLMDQAARCLQERNLIELQQVFETPEWQEEMKDSLAGVTRKVCYRDGETVWMIADDPDAVRILCRRADGTSLLYRGNGTGAVLAEGTCEEMVWNGAFSIEYYDSYWERYRECEGTFAQNLCVGEIRFLCDGQEYIGQFDEKGVTVVEQQKRVTSVGCVIYAYDVSGKQFLYEETTAEDFRLDAEALGVSGEWMKF